MTNVRCVLNDVADKYSTGLSMTNNDAVWLHDICVRICMMVNTFESAGTLHDMLLELHGKHFLHAIPRIDLLDSVRRILMRDNPKWHTITILEMNKCISVFNSIVDYVREYVPTEKLLELCEIQEDIKFPVGTGREELCAILCLRKFGYFRYNVSTVRAKGA